MTAVRSVVVDLMRHLSNSRFEEILTELWRGQPQSSVGQESAGGEIRGRSTRESAMLTMVQRSKQRRSPSAAVWYPSSLTRRLRWAAASARPLQAKPGGTPRPRSPAAK